MEADAQEPPSAGWLVVGAGAGARSGTAFLCASLKATILLVSFDFCLTESGEYTQIT